MAKSLKTIALDKFLANIDTSAESLATYERCIFNQGEELTAGLSEFFQKLDSESKIRLEDLGQYTFSIMDACLDNKV